MKQLVRDAFVANLRSGAYKQGRFSMGSGPMNETMKPPCMCAAGVLADTLGATWCMYREDTWVPTATRFQEANVTLREECELVQMNDKLGMTFPQIAEEVLKWECTS